MEDAPKQELHETTLIEPEVAPTDREENLAKNDNLKQRQHDATGTGDESYEDEEEWDCCSYTKAIAAWVFALILGFCVFGFMIAYASQSQDDTGKYFHCLVFFKVQVVILISRNYKLCNGPRREH